MRLRKPAINYTIWPSGKIVGIGAVNVHEAYKGARRVARHLQKLNFNVRFVGFRVYNIFATCHFPFQIDLKRLLFIVQSFWKIYLLFECLFFL